MNQIELATVQVRDGEIEVWIQRKDKKSRYYSVSKRSAHRIETFIKKHLSNIRVAIYNNTELVLWLHEHNR